MQHQKRRQKSSFPTSDYLNFIKLNKLKLLQRRSSSNPKIFNLDYKLKPNPSLPHPPRGNLDIKQPFSTVDPSQLPSKKSSLRNKNYQMYYKGNVGEPVFNHKLQDLQVEEIKLNRLQSSLESKVRKISRLIYEGSMMEVGKRGGREREEGRSLKEKLSRRSIVALVTVDRANGEVRFPVIKRLGGKVNGSLNVSKERLGGRGEEMSKVFSNQAINSNTNSTPNPNNNLTNTPTFNLYPNPSNSSTNPPPPPPPNPNSPSMLFTNFFCTKRKAHSLHHQHSKIIQTFHQYQRLLKSKDISVNGLPPIRQLAKKQTEEMILKPLRKRLKTECLSKSVESSIELREIKEDEVGERESKQLMRVKQLTLKLRQRQLKEQGRVNGTSSEEVLSHGGKLGKKRGEFRDETVYEMKIRNYKEFVFQVNFAHNRFLPFEIKEEMGGKQVQKYRAYVGRGNNNLLIKQLLRRRCWWSFEEDMGKCQFVWTQLKVGSVFEGQRMGVEGECERVLGDKGNFKVKVGKKKGRNEGEATNKKKNRPDTKVGIQKIFDQIDCAIYSSLPHNQPSPDYPSKLKQLSKPLIKSSSPHTFLLHNHLQHNYHIGNKKALFYYMRQYCRLIDKNVHDYLPLTFHIKAGQKDKEYQSLLTEIKSRELNYKTNKKGARNIWIVKPGEVSNRGSGITVVSNMMDLNRALKGNEKHGNGTVKTYIVQSYLDRPLLYNRRKFDIRHYMLITSLYGQTKAYWYSDGYIRTSSQQFSLNDLSNTIIHLTNDAIQKNGCQYGEFQQANKLSYTDLQRYLDNTYPEKKINFYEHIYPRMKEIGTKAIEATWMKLNPRRLEHGFQVLGLDFMIDQDFNVWMIEVNTNPCLEISSPLLGRIIPGMIEQSLRLSLDVLFPPLGHLMNTQKHLFPDYSLEHLKFEMVFDEQRDGKRLRELYGGKGGEEEMRVECGKVDEEEEEYENEGDEVEEEEIMGI